MIAIPNSLKNCLIRFVLTLQLRPNGGVLPGTRLLAFTISALRKIPVTDELALLSELPLGRSVLATPSE